MLLNPINIILSNISYLEMELQEDNHLSVAGLEKRVLDVVVHDVHLVSPDRGVPEAVHVRLEGAREALLYDVGSDVEILEKKLILLPSKNHYRVGLVVVDLIKLTMYSNVPLSAQVLSG